MKILVNNQCLTGNILASAALSVKIFMICGLKLSHILLYILTVFI